MARFVYDSSKVNAGLDYLKEAKRKLNGIRNGMNAGITTIRSARGYKWLDVDFSSIQSLEDNARTMISSLEKLINEKINMINEYNTYRNEHPIKSKFADFSMGSTSVLRGIVGGFTSLGDGVLAMAGAVGGAFGNETWKECCEEELADRKIDNWFAKQYESGIWSDVEKYSSFSSKSTKATVFRGVGSAVPFVAAAVATGGASAAGTISTTTALAADSTLAAYSALGDRTASGLAAGEDFDTAYQKGTVSAAVAGVSTFALGKGAEKIGSAITSTKGATSAAGSADDLTKMANNWQKAEKELNTAYKAGASEAELGRLEAARDSAKNIFIEAGGDSNKVAKTASKLEEAEKALSNGKKSGLSEAELGKLEEARDVARKSYNDSIVGTKKTVTPDKGSMTNKIKEKTSSVKAQASEKISNVKAQASEKISNVKAQASEKVSNVKAQASEKLSGVKDKISGIGKKGTTTSDDVFANAVKNGDADTINAMKNAKTSNKSMAEAIKSGDADALNAMKNAKTGNKSMAEAIKSGDADALNAMKNAKTGNKSMAEAIKSGDADALNAMKNAKTSNKSMAEAIKSGDADAISSIKNSAENSSSKIFTGSDSYADARVAEINKSFAESEKKFNNGVKTLKDTIATSGSGSKAKDLEEVGKYMYEADKKLNLAYKSGASSAEIEELEIARDSAKQVFRDMGGDADDFLMVSRLVDNTEDNLLAAVRSGASESELEALEVSRDAARSMYNSTYGVADDVAKQTSKIETMASNLKNVKANVKETVGNVTTKGMNKIKGATENISAGASKVKSTIKGASANLSEGVSKAGAGIKNAGTVFVDNTSKMAGAVGTATKNIGVAAMKHPVAASVAVGSTVGLSTAHAANPRVVNTDLAGINVANLSDSVMTASAKPASSIFENKTAVADGDDNDNNDTPKNTDDSTVADNGTGTDNGGGNGNGNGNSRYGSEIVSTDAKNDKTKKIIDQITRKDKLKPGNINVDNNTNNNTNTVVPNPNNNVNPTTNNTIENKDVPQQPVRPNNTVAPSNTEVVAHQVSNNEGSRTVYAGATTVTGGEGGSASYSGYSGGGNYNNSSIASATKEVINKTKPSVGTDIGSKVKNIIGQKKINPIVIDDTAPTSGKSGVGLAVGGVVAAGAAIGLGTKAVLDKRKASEEYEDDGDEIEEITKDDSYDTDSAVYDDTKENSDVEMLYDDPYEAEEGQIYDDSYDDIAYGEVEDLVTF